MKAKFWVLILGICLMWTVAVLAATGLWNPVESMDFQGKSRMTFEGKISKELRRGKWINDDGGIFEGNTTIENGQKEIKEGKLTTPVFQGKFNYSGSSDSWESSMEGRELLIGGGVFEGKKTFKRNLDNSQEIIREGNFTTAVFQGVFKRSEKKDKKGAISSQEITEGKELLSDGGVFEGEKILDSGKGLSKIGGLVTPTFQGIFKYKEQKDESNKITSQERVVGVWRVTPTFGLLGDVTTKRLSDGKVTVQDNRYEYEKGDVSLPDKTPPSTPIIIPIDERLKESGSAVPITVYLFSFDPESGISAYEYWIEERWDRHGVVGWYGKSGRVQNCYLLESEKGSRVAFNDRIRVDTNVFKITVRAAVRAAVSSGRTTWFGIGLYFGVRVMNGAGLWSEIAYSDGIRGF